MLSLRAAARGTPVGAATLARAAALAPLQRRRVVVVKASSPGGGSDVGGCCGGGQTPSTFSSSSFSSSSSSSSLPPSVAASSSSGGGGCGCSGGVSSSTGNKASAAAPFSASFAGEVSVSRADLELAAAATARPGIRRKNEEEGGLTKERFIDVAAILRGELQEDEVEDPEAYLDKIV